MKPKEWDKISKDYHDYIMSPLRSKIKNPIFSDIKNISRTKTKTVIDIGTGVGDLLPFLSKNFKKVIATDFSQGMIQQARKRHSKLGNISFYKKDTRELIRLKTKIDVAIAVNSILVPSFVEVQKSLEIIYSILNKKGKFIGIFPAMEGVIYNAMLIYEREFKKLGDPKKARAKTRRIVELKNYDFVRFLHIEDKEAQKYYFRFELLQRLKQAGFKNIKIKKVHYPWGGERESFGEFKDRPGVWDWYVIAEK